MTDAPSNTPDISATVLDLKGELWRLSYRAAFRIAGFGAIAVLSGVELYRNFIGEAGGGVLWMLGAFIGLTGAAVVAAVVYVRFRQAQETLVMPLVAKAAGLTYEKLAMAFVEKLPKRLLPNGPSIYAEDLIDGQLGNHRIRMAEVNVTVPEPKDPGQAGHDTTRTLFRGLVAQMEFKTAFPTFLIVQEEWVRPEVLRSRWLKTDGLVRRRVVESDKAKPMSVWTPEADPFDPVASGAMIDRLCQIASRVSAPVTLFAAVGEGNSLSLALTHARNLFKVGGFFPSDERLLADVQRAMQDFGIALELAREMIAVEELAQGTKA